MNAYDKWKKTKQNEAPLLALSSGDNNIKNLCFVSFGGYHYTFIYVFIC